ncbi:Elongation factor 1-gamma [Holothuria leucospilota]|uniref:Elongation factor 1-gamma n=1 Tax=Holothuria leucospilota TaxID=206669 RepID=A0A9Q1HHL3_HOLLE|nr:Elongation factor 1-gamma [Holothuria leucospilota]
MASGTLYTYPENVRAQKVLIAAKYSGANVAVVQDPPAFKLGETNKSPDFLKKFPLGKVPAFEGSDGTLLYESNAIAYYVANEQLRGSTTKDQALVQQFVNLADNEILPSAATWVYPTLGVMQYNKQNTERAKEQIKKVLSYLQEYLKTRTFLVGERITLADISVGCNLIVLYKQVLDPAFRKPYGNVNRYFTTLVNQSEFKEVLGQVTLADKQAQFDAAKFAELSGGGGGGKKDKKKEKKQEKPKQEKKKESKKAKKDDDDDEPPPDVPPEPKKADPFANAPKSSFILDDWKKVYSNEDTIKKAIPYFWENLDRENWSVWYSEYKYPEELKMVFMSSNLVGGMFQRLDKMRKHAFASVVISGTDNNNTITGVWLWRGQDLIFPLDTNWTIDYDVYSWRKMDLDDEAEKKLIETHLLQDGDFGGKECADAKTFK